MKVELSELKCTLLEIMVCRLQNQPESTYGFQGKIITYKLVFDMIIKNLAPRLKNHENIEINDKEASPTTYRATP